MAIKITDVARHAGVSMKTVSRVLNREPNVTEKTRLKVQASVDALQYRPSFAARGLAGSRSYLLALLYGDASAEYIHHLQRGATQACREFGFHLMVEPISLSGDELTQDMRSLLQHLPVDGLILTPPLSNSEPLLGLLRQTQTPYIRIAPTGPDDDMPCVVIDDFEAGYEITKYLLDLGHRDIGCIVGRSMHSASLLRYDGYEKALGEMGIAVNKDWIFQGDFSFESGAACAKQILSLKERPSAIFASNDAMAAGVISVAQQSGLSLPQDLSVCGFDDTALASIIWPALTTVRQPIHEMGYMAAQILTQKSGTQKGSAQEPLRHVLSYEIIVRDSACRHK